MLSLLRYVKALILFVWNCIWIIRLRWALCSKTSALRKFYYNADCRSSFSKYSVTGSRFFSSKTRFDRPDFCLVLLNFFVLMLKYCRCMYYSIEKHLAISDTAGQGFQNTPWPAVDYFVENTLKSPESCPMLPNFFVLMLKYCRCIYATVIRLNFEKYSTAGHGVFWQPWPAVSEIAKCNSISANNTCIDSILASKQRSLVTLDKIRAT